PAAEDVHGTGDARVGVAGEQRDQARDASGGATGAYVELQPATVLGRPARLCLDPLADAPGAVAAGPRSRQRPRVVVSREPVIGRHDKASFGIALLRHVLEADDAGPLVLRVPAGTVAALCHFADRNAADALVSDVP